MINSKRGAEYFINFLIVGSTQRDKDFSHRCKHHLSTLIQDFPGLVEQLPEYAAELQQFQRSQRTSGNRGSNAEIFDLILSAHKIRRKDMQSAVEKLIPHLPGSFWKDS